MTAFLKDSHHLFRAPRLSSLAWVEHGFGTRHTPGWTEGRPSATLKQIHSDRIVRVDGDGAERFPTFGEGDALITNSGGVLLTIRTADCVPLLLADSKRRVVGAVHAGWRGSAAGIARKTVERMMEEYGSDPGDLVVAIGPSIGACCYEVGAEVAERFCESLPPNSVKIRSVDLVMVNRHQLVQAGVPSNAIEASGLCTRCQGGDFHSYRRDKELAGRMESAIAITRSEP